MVIEPDTPARQFEGLDEPARRLAIGFDLLELPAVSTMPRP
jgi:hypothetical protein